MSEENNNDGPLRFVKFNKTKVKSEPEDYLIIKSCRPKSLKIAGRQLNVVDMDQCINKDFCLGCRHSYMSLVLITKTGLGFCSEPCFKNFMTKWKSENGEADIKNMLMSDISVIELSVNKN